MGHVLDLPGCFTRGDSREHVLGQLPQALDAYRAWLAHHGELLVDSGRSAEDEVKLEVVGESEGTGPFKPGDTAAFFPPDREPVRLDEMEMYLRLSGHARSDLLALIEALPRDAFEWQPYPDWFSIGRVLRHVGDAEEWYVSRLVPPETLPPEWDHDADLPLFDFLEMERRTVFARLRELTAEERGGVYTPNVWTRHPEEVWTLRKVLRRLLEHELEHTDQIRRTLALYRQGLVALLAARQATLLEALLGLSEEALRQERAAGDQTAPDLLARLVAGHQGQLQAIGATEAWQQRGLDELVAELDAVHASGLDWLAAVPEEALFREGGLPGVVEMVAAQLCQLEGATDRLAAWREGRVREAAAAPSLCVLRGALVAGRRELLAACSVILAGERSRPVCGTWTLQDVVGHVADWELLGVEGLRHMAAGRAPDVEAIPDIDAWNEAHVTARRGQPPEVAWTDLREVRQALLETLEGMGDRALSQRFPFPWGGEGTSYQWLRIYLAHDREHAGGLRQAVAMPPI